MTMKANELVGRYTMEKHPENGTFVTCITVPRFTYDGFEIIEREKMLEMYPESAEFWNI